jgi:REP element-mobilizing transposase RayT
MSRALRIQYEGAYYHVACRGNERRTIFRGDDDRFAFLDCLERSADIYDVRILCYVLMDNHFHLVIQTKRANLSEFMRHFNISYTAAFNRRHRRSGHLYQGRYHAILIEKDSYLLEVSRYLHLNPVRIKSIAAKGAEEKSALLSKYRWSSYRGYVSARRRQSFVDYSEVLGSFGGETASGRRRYGAFVREGIDAEVMNPFKQVVGQLILGGEEFVEYIRERFLSKEDDTRERPAVQVIARNRSPENVIEVTARIMKISPNELCARGAMTAERGLAMEVLYRYCGLTQARIGELLGGLDYSTVSVNRKKFLDKLQKDKRLRQKFAEITEALGG